MRERGFRRSYGKIWHSHHASIRANQKSGFREIALVVDLYPFGGTRRVRWVRRRAAGSGDRLHITRSGVLQGRKP